MLLPNIQSEVQSNSIITKFLRLIPRVVTCVAPIFALRSGGHQQLSKLSGIDAVAQLCDTNALATSDKLVCFFV